MASAIQERIERVKIVLGHQREVMRHIDDAGNLELPGFISEGAGATMDWAVSELEAIQGIAGQEKQVTA